MSRTHYLSLSLSLSLSSHTHTHTLSLSLYTHTLSLSLLLIFFNSAHIHSLFVLLPPLRRTLPSPHTVATASCATRWRATFATCSQSLTLDARRRPCPCERCVRVCVRVCVCVCVCVCVYYGEGKNQEKTCVYVVYEIPFRLLIFLCIHNNNKKGVVVTARVHPGETNASWMMKGFIDFITGNSPDAQVKGLINNRKSTATHPCKNNHIHHHEHPRRPSATILSSRLCRWWIPTAWSWATTAARCRAWTSIAPTSVQIRTFTPPCLLPRCVCVHVKMLALCTHTHTHTHTLSLSLSLSLSLCLYSRL